jgi:hypothetical protein
MGGNAARLGMLFGGPVLACVLHGRRARVLAVLALPLLYWSIAPAVRDVAAAAGDPSTSAAYYAPLLRFLDSARNPGTPPPRIEIVFTRNHWEAARVAPHIPIARGWERQVDRKVNKLFYKPGLTAEAYRTWLERTGVRWVALPDAKLDYSAKAEAQLIRAGLPYLRPAWHSAHWRVFAVRPAPALVEGPASLTAMGAESFSVRARRAGRVVVRVRFTSHWSLPQAAGCVTRSPEGWTELHLRHPGRVSVTTELGGDDGPRCPA